MACHQICGKQSRLVTFLFYIFSYCHYKKKRMHIRDTAVVGFKCTLAQDLVTNNLAPLQLIGCVKCVDDLTMWLWLFCILWMLISIIFGGRCVVLALSFR